MAVGLGFFLVSRDCSYLLASSQLQSQVWYVKSLQASILRDPFSCLISCLCSSSALLLLTLLPPFSVITLGALNGSGWPLYLRISWLVIIMLSTEFLHDSPCLYHLHGKPEGSTLRVISEFWLLHSPITDFFFFFLMFSVFKIILSYNWSGVLFVEEGVVNLFPVTPFWTQGDVSIQAFSVALPSGSLRWCLCIAIRSGEGPIGIPEGSCFTLGLGLISNIWYLSESDLCYLGACEHAGLTDWVVTVTSTLEIHGLVSSTLMQD